MSVQSILEARERAGAKVSFLPVENFPGRQKIQDALDTIAAEIARLRVLQRAEDRRQAARAETAAFVEQARRKFEHRQAVKHLKITIDREFFYDIGMLALQSVHGEAFTELQKELTRVWERKE
jgi:hypothetical protein